MLVEYGCALKGERGYGGTSSSWYYQSWRGRRSCIICRRHWSDYGQTYNIQKNCHTGELTFPLLFTISSFAAALIFCLWKGIQQTSTRQRYGATKHDTVTWLAVSVSLPTLLGYQRASAFVNATKLASQPLFSSDEEYKISNVLSNTFFIDIDHVSIAIHIVIVLSPSPTLDTNSDSNIWLDEPHFKRAVFMWKVIFSNIAFDQLTY